MDLKYVNLRCIDGNLLYLAAFAIFLFQMNLNRMSWGTLFGYSKGGICFRFQILVMILLFLKVVLYQRARLWRWVLPALLVALGIITYRIVGMSGNMLFWTALFIACGKDIDLQDAAKAVFAVYLGMCIVTVCLACAGVIENYVSTRPDGSLRYAMGYGHPNSFGLTLFMICLSFCVMRYGKQKRPTAELAAIIVCAYISQTVANSRTYTMALCILAVFVLMLYYVRSRYLQAAVRILFAAVAAVLVASSLYFMLFYTDSNALFVRLNELMTTRLSLSNMYYEICSVRLFGMDVFEGTGLTIFVVDNAYCQFLIKYGVIAFGLSIIGFIAFYADQIRRYSWEFALFGMTLFMIIGFSEARVYEVGCNFFLLVFARMLWGTGKSASPEPTQEESHAESIDYHTGL